MCESEREREREGGGTSRARRGAARARVIWRRQVIDSPSGDNARRPQRASLYPVTGTGQTAYISKAIADDPASRVHSTRGFLSRALIHAYPRRPTQLIDIRRSRRHLRTREDRRRRRKIIRPRCPRREIARTRFRREAPETGSPRMDLAGLRIHKLK